MPLKSFCLYGKDEKLHTLIFIILTTGTGFIDESCKPQIPSSQFEHEQREEEYLNMKSFYAIKKLF